MKRADKYNLEQAIKKFYETEPLKIDLAKAVSSKVFVKYRSMPRVVDNYLCIFAVIILVVSIIYSFNFISQISLFAIGSFAIISIGFFSLSVKEFSVMSKKLLQ